MLKMDVLGVNVKVIEHPVVEKNKFIANKKDGILYIPTGGTYQFIFRTMGVTEKSLDLVFDIAKQRGHDYIDKITPIKFGLIKNADAPIK